ncbi:MAG: glycosyltransferase family 2 protein [candidate division WOR-3 bacterium]
MKLSVVIPVYNERKTIKKVIEKVKLSPVEKEIIIVDDGYNDGTSSLLDELAKKENNIKIIHLNKNVGKGQAIKESFSLVKGVIIQNADLEYDPGEYPKLLEPLPNKEAEVVFGSRLLKRINKRDGLFYFGRVLITWVANSLFKNNLTDAYTCYKVLPRDFVKNLKITSTGFELEAELTAKLLLSKKKIKEIPINYLSTLSKRRQKDYMERLV